MDTGPLSLDSSALSHSLELLARGFSHLPALASTRPAEERQAMNRVLLEVAERLTDNFPYFHPLYAGQMLKPPHPIARLAYALAQTINPNNHALDGGRASSAMEKEAVAEIARMFGWEDHLGHLCSGGTFANLEALWIAGQLHPGKVILASERAHYTHSRICGVLKIPFESVPSDRFGRLDLEALHLRLERGDVGTVVATLGTTAVGSIDPLPGILDLHQKHGFRIHVDAAYGGYFRLCEGLSAETRRAFDRLPEVDSIVVDPHKHGLQPYGCGCVLFRDPAVGRFYKHDSPYTYFSSSELHLGEISLECSRPGASAVALWATQRLLPLVKGGAFAQDLERSRQAALDLFKKVQEDRRFLTALPPELDIVIWAPRSGSVSQASVLSRRMFEEAEGRYLSLALADLPVALFDLPDDMKKDRELITCLRSVLMKPEHLDWIDEIWSRLDAATRAALDPKA